MNILRIPSLAFLFDFNPTPTSAKFDTVEIPNISDASWQNLMKHLAKDLNLHATKDGKSLYKDQKRAAFITTIDPNEGATPFA